MAFNYLFKPPGTWDDFEDLVCNLVRLEFNNPNFQRYGRQGQPQNGIDLFGVIDTGVVGIQCKRYEKKLSPSQVKDIIKEGGKFEPTLSRFIIATTTSRDKKTDRVIMDSNRDPGKLFETAIWYWEDIVDRMKNHPKLIFKAFGSDYSETLNEVHRSIYAFPQRSPLIWPCSQADLESHCKLTMGNPQKVITPYTLSIGISGFPQCKQLIPTDLNIDLTSFINEKKPLQAFEEIGNVFDELSSVISHGFFDTQIVFDLKLYLPHAFLLGHSFRRKKGWNPVFVQDSLIWPSQGLDEVNPGLRIHTPYLTGSRSTEIAIVLGRRDLKKRVIENIDNWEEKPRLIYFFSCDSYIRNSAVPMSLSYAFASTINSLIDEGEAITKIHMFLAVPKSLAALIAANLGRTCPISLYHLDREGKTYQLSGTIEME